MEIESQHNVHCPACNDSFCITRVITKMGDDLAYDKNFKPIICLNEKCNEVLKRIEVKEVTIDAQLNKWSAQNKEYAKM